MADTKRPIIEAWVLLLAIAMLPLAASSDGFRCGGQIIQRDDRAAEVRELCGDPDARVPLHTVHSIRYGQVTAREEWQYNLGPRRLMRFLTFRNGRLTHIRTGTHGFRENSGNCRPTALRIGMPQMELESRCGEPLDKSLIITATDHRRNKHGHFVARSQPAEEWVYDFGSNRFRRLVILVHGRVAKIERSSNRGGS